MKIVSWNIDGLNAGLTGTSNRALLTQKTLREIASLNPDVIAIQETKLSELSKKHINVINEIFPGYHIFNNMSKTKAGYAGTMFLYRDETYSGHKFDYSATLLIEENIKNNNLPDLDIRVEGRISMLNISNNMTILNLYVPNIGRDTKEIIDYREQFDIMLLKTIKSMHDSGRSVILCGDFNVAHREIDLKNPKGNEGNPGFTAMERKGFDAYLTEGDTVDAFRHIHGDIEGMYTWFTQLSKTAKANNSGWRIDYILTSNSIANKIVDVKTIDTGERKDHSPLFMEINI